MLLTVKPFYMAVAQTLSGFDPYYDAVTLLLHAEGANGSQVITDEKGHTATVGSGVTLSTATSMFGSSCLKFDNTATATMYYNGSSDFAFGYDDFTIEAFVKTNSFGTTLQTIFDTRPANVNGAYICLYLETTGAISTYVNSVVQLTSATKLSTNTWAHVALSRTNQVTSLFINGALQGSVVDATNYLNGASRPSIGNSGYYSGGTTPWNGYIDELRVTKGVGRYIAGAVPAFTTDANTKLLAHFENNLTDVVGNTITNSGATFSSTISKSGSYSAYFNGASYAAAPAAVGQFGSGEFTVEGWAYLPANGGYQTLFGTLNHPTDGWAVQQNRVMWFDGSGFHTGTYSASVPANSWAHVAFVRLGNTITVYINGASVFSGAVSGALTSNAALRFGYRPDGNEFMTGYLDEVRVSNVARYTANYTVAMPAPTTIPTSTMQSTLEGAFDPYYGNTVLMIHGNDTVGLDTTFVDSSINQAAITRYGNVRQGLNNPFGTTTDGSIYFNGSTDYLTLPYSNIATQWWNSAGFTIEAWVYPIAYTSSTLNSNTDPVLVGNQTVGSASSFWSFGLDSAGHVKLYYFTGSQNRIIGTGVVALNTWTHIAMVVSGTTVKFYINGVLDTTSAISGTPQSGSTSPFVVGAGGNGYFNGFISNMRIVAGTSIYTTGFIPPTSSLTNIAGTQLLLNTKNNGYVSDNTQVLDYSSNTLLLTNAGSTSLVPASPFGTLGQSLSFNGSTQKLTTSANAGLAFGTGDFTVEFWLFPLSFVNYITYVSTRTGANTTSWSIGTQAAGQILFYAGSEILRSSATLTLNAWQHIAIVRKNGVISGYINGVKYAADVANTYNFTANVATVGGDPTFGEFAPAYLSNVRITNNAVYSAPFTPSTTPLTAVSGTQLLAANKPYSFLSNTALMEAGSGLPIAVNGAPINTGVYPFATQSSSIFFTGATPDYLKMTAPTTIGFGTGDYTVEYWLFPTAYGATTSVITDMRAQSTGVYWVDQLSTAGKYLMYNVATATTYYTSTTVIPLNKWTHVASVRTSGILRVYINGILDGQQADVQNWTLPSVANNVTVGISNWAGQLTSAFAYYGYLSARFVKGSALYSGLSFALPTTPFTAVAGTVLMLRGDTPYTIDSLGGTYVNVSGSAVVTKAKSRQGATSLYFDGAAATRLVVKSPCAASPFLGNFTIEMWFYGLSGAASWNFLLDSEYVVNDVLGLSIGFNSSYQLWMGYSSGPTYTIAASAATAFSPNQWNHIALTRQGNYYYLWLNGRQIGSYLSAQTFTSNTIWTIGNQVAGNYGVKGYIDEFRVTAGIARYTSTFSPKQQSAFADAGPTYDPFYAQNELVITGGTATAQVDTTFNDNSGTQLAVLKAGSPYQGIINPFSTSTDGSIYFNGTTDYLSIPNSKSYLNLNSNNFTIEGWFNRQATGVVQDILDARGIVGDTNSTWCLSIGGGSYSADNKLLFTAAATNAGTSGSPFVTLHGTTAFQVGVWYHFAIVRNGNVWTMYVNGASEATATNSSTVGNSASLVYLGAGCNGAGTIGYYNKSYFSNIRVVNGTAVYTSNFTVPAASLPVVSNTVLLLNTKNSGFIVIPSANTIKEWSGSGRTFTQPGTPTIQAASPFASGVGQSLSLNGTTQYISMSQTMNFAADFTIECWFNANTVTPATQGIIGDNYSNAGPFKIQLATNTLVAYVPSNSGVVNLGTVVAGTWYHVAVVRIGTAVSFYLNGAKVATTSVGGALNSANSPQIGAMYANTTVTNFFNGFISNVRIVIGTGVYTGAFTVPTTPLTAVANTQLLMFNQNYLLTSNQVFVDNSANNFPVIATGAPSQCSISPFAAGGYSAYFNGSTDYLSAGTFAASTIGSSDFTAEAWFNVSSFGTAGTARGYIIGTASSSYFPIGIATYVDSSGRNILQAWLSSTGTSWDMISGVGQDSSQITTVGSSLSTGIWYHIALVRSGNTFTSYLNGVQQVQWTKSTALMAPTQAGFIVGGIGNANNWLKGYIASARFVKGSAVYVGAFTPSTTPLTSITNTQVLFNFSNVAVQDATGNRSLALIGSTQASTAVAKFGTNSIAFNGSTDYISIPDYKYLEFGAADFTIEMWVYPSSSTNAMTLFSKRATSAGLTSLVIHKIASSTQVSYWASSNGTSFDIANGVSMGSMVLNQWNHIALVRSGGVFIPFVNGAAGTATNSTATIIAAANPVLIGGDTDAMKFQGFMDDIRITKGVARYLANFKLPSASYNSLLAIAATDYDPYEQNVVFALQGSISDLKQHAVTVTGSPAVSTAVAKFGAKSLYLNGSSTKLTYAASIDWYLADTFTIEFWMYPTVAPASGNQCRLLLLGANATSSALYVGYGNDGSIGMWVPNTGITGIMAPAGTIVLNTWQHIAISVQNGIATIYKNGVQVAQVVGITAQTLLATNTLILGYDTVATVNAQYTGYLQDFRITKGVARYLANFTAPTLANPTYGLDA
jgi:hypothetical protein